MELTTRENEVLEALATGQTDAEIAQQLEVSINTLKTHLKSIYRKLKVRNRVEAIQLNQQKK